MSDNGASGTFQSRRAVLSTVAVTTGAGLFVGSSSAKSANGDGRDFLKLLERVKERHGELTGVDVENRGRMQFITATFGGNYEVRFKLNRVGNGRAKVTFNGNNYIFKKENYSYKKTSSRKPNQFGSSEFTTSGVTTTGISVGDTQNISSADNYKYRGYGGSLGSKWVDHDLSDFEAESAVEAYGIGYRAQVTDVYKDVSVGSSVSKLELDYSYDYKWGGNAFGSASTALEGEVIIRNLDKGENIAVSEIFENSGTFAEFRTGSDTGSGITAGNVSGSGNYRVGIRAYTEIDAGGPGLCTASISRSGTSHYFDIGSVQLSAF